MRGHRHRARWGWNFVLEIFSYSSAFNGFGKYLNVCHRTFLWMCYVHCTELFQMIERTRQDQKGKVRERGKGDCLLCQVNIHRGKDWSSTFQTRAGICKNPCNGRADVSFLPSDGEAICLTARQHTVVRLYVVDTVDTLGKIE